MNGSQLALIGACALAVCALAMIVVPASARPRRAGGGSTSVPSPWPVVGGMVVSAATYSVTGWLFVALVVGVLIGIAVARWVRARAAGTAGDRREASGVERVEALASWVENVRDVLRAGNQPIGAIGATVDTCPVVIRTPVRQLFARLSAGQSADVALRRFADEMDDPLADLVAIGLLISVTRGSQTEQVLSSLAEQARHQADRRRIVEAERAPMRREVQLVCVVMCLLLAALFVFGRSDYLDAYDTPSGQVFLGFVVCGYAALVAWVGRLATFPAPARFLTMRGDHAVQR